MTRDEAIELLKLMERLQNDEDSVAPLNPEMLARGYVRIVSRPPTGRGKDRDDGPGGRESGAA